MNNDFFKELKNLTNLEVFQDKLLSSFTTMGVGGNADYFISVNNTEEMLKTIKIARKYHIPVFILGKGSNIIISDKGINGLVIHNNIQTYEILNNYYGNSEPVMVKARHGFVDKSLEIDKYGLAWSDQSTVQYIKVGTGWKLMVVIQKLVEQGLVGLEWFYGIAGSVGGAVYMNVHGGAHQLFSHFLTEVEVINEKNEIETLKASDLEFDYDYSLFHKRKLVMTNVVLRLFKGDKDKAQQVISDWGREKIIKQPQRSSGCMFQNLPEDKREEFGLPTPSMGYVIDKVLGLSGTQIGGAKISQKHCAFIENTGNATASDVKTIVDLVKTKMKEKFDFDPPLEVEFIGEF